MTYNLTLVRAMGRHSFKLIYSKLATASPQVSQSITAQIETNYQNLNNVLRLNEQNDLIAVEELSLLATNAQQNNCSVCFVAAKNDLVQISLQLVGSAGVLALNSEQIYGYYRNLAKRPELDDFLNKTENDLGSELLAVNPGLNHNRNTSHQKFYIFCQSNNN